MENITLTIKRSTNIHAWQNRYVGREVKAIVTDSGYKVIFSDNTHLQDHNDLWVQGHLDHEDNTTIKEELKFTRNPLALR